jgi:hypothetical protein
LYFKQAKGEERMSDSYDDYEAKMQLAEHAWEVKTEQEPVAFCNGMPAYEGSLSKAQRLTQDLEAPLTINGVPLYPKKAWVWLTPYEIQEIYLKDPHWGNFACAIEQALKEKNHG